MRGPDRPSTLLARKLRTRQTDAEAKLWRHLRNRQIANAKFVRQAPIGSYICDFACREQKLIIEVDGGQHCESMQDARRTSDLSREGYRVMRFWNNEVLENIEGVLLTIQTTLSK